MAKHIMVALVDAAEGQDEAFNAWYATHMRELQEIPSIVSAKRYRRARVQAPGAAPVDSGYLAIYELDGDPAAILGELVRRRADGEWAPREGMNEATIKMWCFEAIGDDGEPIEG